MHYPIFFRFLGSINFCHFPDFFFLAVLARERVSVSEVSLGLPNYYGSYSTIKESKWAYLCQLFIQRLGNNHWVCPWTHWTHWWARPGPEHHLLLCHILPLYQRSRETWILTRILPSWNIWIVFFPCCKCLKALLGSIVEILLYIWPGFLGSFLLKIWPLFQSIDSRRENWLLFRSWTWDHDFHWVASLSLLIVQTWYFFVSKDCAVRF